MNPIQWRGQRLLRAAAVFTLIMVMAAGIVVRGSPAAQAASFQAGDLVTVDTDRLNLRDSPSLSGDVILSMDFGSQIIVQDGPVAADDYNWYEVEYVVSASTSHVGWAAGEFLTIGSSGNPLPPGTHDENFPTGAVVMVDTDRLNFRAAPGLDADVIRVLDYETAAVVEDGPISANGYHWYQVALGAHGDGASGWLIGEGLAMLGGADPTTPGDNIGDGTFAAGDAVTVATDRLNLRDAAGLDGNVLAVLPNGTSGEVTDGPVSVDGYDWYEVSWTGAETGWVVGGYLTLAEAHIAFYVGESVHVIDGTLNLRTGASLSASVNDVMAEGAELTIAAGPTFADGYTWYRVTSDEYGSGWVAGEFLEASA